MAKITQEYHGLFRSLQDENKFYKRFDYLVSEFGVDNLCVYLPAHWAEDFADYEDAVRIRFETHCEIKIVVHYEFILIEETTPLFEISFSRSYRRRRCAA